MAKATTLLALNQELPTTNEFEQDAKASYRIYLKSFLNNDVVETADLAELRTIAAKCPAISGASVFLSRELLPKSEGRIYDDSACGTEIIGGKITKNGTNTTLFPNPANDYLTIHLPKQTESLSISIIDMNGRVIARHDASNNAVLTIDTSAFANGIYSVQYSDSGMQAQKLVIQH